MRLALVACVLVSAAAAVALDAWATPAESWVGSRYGWTSNPPPTCRPAAPVCSTEDGGASWHGIFTGGTFVFGVVRTSATAGVVSTGRQLSARFWTRDNGRHWYRTRKIGGEFQGSGPYLFWISFGPALHEVRPWPPRGRARCRGVWAASAFDTVAARRGNVCSGRAVEAGMKTSPVFRLQEGRFTGLANVPGGILATVDGPGGPRLLLYQRGRARIVELPAAGGATPCVGRAPLVTWPRIAVVGCAGAGAPDVAWVSEDGGKSWRAIAA